MGMKGEKIPIAVNQAYEFTAPLYVAWEITHHCNARCLHCYSASGPDAGFQNQLPLEQALELIDQLADAGVLVLAFSGGEPLMHPAWEKLVGHACKRGLNVNVGSNGSCITDQNADLINNLGVKSVTISLDSHLPEKHDYFRQFEGLYSKAINAIEKLVSRKIRVVVGFTPTRVNWTDGLEVIELAHKLGADAVNLSEYVPAGRGSLDLALEPDELHRILQQWITAREHYKGRMEIMWHDCRVGLLVEEEERKKYVGCGAGRLVARILPDGVITPCVFLPTAIGSIQNLPFKQLWSRSALLQQFRARHGHIQGNCGACDQLQSCGGCRAVAYAYSGGNPLAGDPHCWINRMSDATRDGLAKGEALPI